MGRRYSKLALYGAIVGTFAFIIACFCLIILVAK